MHTLRSRNQELNDYINSFINIHYQPLKMFCWRTLVLFAFSLFSIIKDYQYYQFSVDRWFAWAPIFIVIAGILTINFQSLYLGSMSYRYRYHDAAFQIAKMFFNLEYSPLINGLEHKLSNLKKICYKAKIALFSLLFGAIGLIAIQTFIFRPIVSIRGYLIASIIYAFLMLILTLAAIITVLFVVSRDRQIELMELSLFWLGSASTLKYIDQFDT